MEVPDLLDLQIDSFDWLIGSEAWRERVKTALDQGRTDINTKSGLEEIFEEISPIEDFSGTMSLSFGITGSSRRRTPLTNARSATSPTPPRSSSPPSS